MTLMIPFHYHGFHWCHQIPYNDQSVNDPTSSLPCFIGLYHLIVVFHLVIKVSRLNIEELVAECNLLELLGHVFYLLMLSLWIAYLQGLSFSPSHAYSVWGVQGCRDSVWHSQLLVLPSNARSVTAWRWRVPLSSILGTFFCFPL